MVQNTLVCGNCGTNTSNTELCSNCGYALAGDPIYTTVQSNSNNTSPIIGGSTSSRITDTLPSDSLLGSRYRIVEMIGRGSFGAVYKATDEHFQAQRIVAVKEMSDFLLSPDEKVKALQDFRNEANLLAQLDHPNLPNVNDVFEEDGKAYLVMKFIEGKTLEEVQKEQSDPLDERQVMGWASQLCTVLHYLHTQPEPVIFRDIKPANVMVTSKGEIKLIDFGIARIFKAAAKQDTTQLGSHGYAPLEQYGSRQSDARSDVYALGATLYNLLTKELPTDAPDRSANPTHFTLPRQLNSNISAAVEAVILKAMAEKPQDRYQTADDMYQAIAAIGQTRPSNTSVISTAVAPVPPQPAEAAEEKPQEEPHISPTQNPAIHPASMPPDSQSRPNRQNPAHNPVLTAPFWTRILAVVVIIGLILSLGGCIALLVPRLGNTPGSGISIINKPNNEQIGISDGTYAFDTGADRVDASLKKQASAKFAQGDKVGATSLWNQAIGIDTSDAEALIYLENQSILDSGSPYITLVVGTLLTGNTSNISEGRDNLQGAYIAQKEYNDGSKLHDGKKIRLLVANAGSKPDYTTEVASLIVQAIKDDTSIIGVMGWPYSANALKATPILAKAHIPMVSSDASTDLLTGISPYFFRIVPPNISQAIASAKYAEQQLNAKNVALFVDTNDPYCNTLAAGFKKQFVDVDGNKIVDTENYTRGDKEGHLPALLQKALNSNPDLIYFAGYANDLAVLLANIPSSQPNLQVLGGDAFYQLGGYSSTARLSLSRLRFTAFAYPDEWSILGMKEPPPFFDEYKLAFNPTGADHSAKPYGFTRANSDTILSYDAMIVLLQGYQNGLGIKEPVTSDALQKGLTQITGAKAIQGLSGQISFGKDGDPINKAVIILYVNPEGHIHMLEKDGVQGCFELGKCG